MQFRPCEGDAWATAVERLRGYQVLRFSEAFELLGGTPDEANPTDWDGLLELLTLFGYESRWMRRRHNGLVEQLFARPPWPGDSEVWREMGMTAFVEA